VSYIKIKLKIDYTRGTFHKII